MGVKTPLSDRAEQRLSFAWAINLQRGKWEWFAELQFQQVSMNCLLKAPVDELQNRKYGEGNCVGRLTSYSFSGVLYAVIPPKGLKKKYCPYL